MENDWYEVLGVADGASSKEIRRAYRALALRHHPDRNPGDPQAGKKLKRINAAYEVLGDPEQRQSYDRDRRLSAYLRQPASPGPTTKTWKPPPEPPAAEQSAKRGLTGRQAVGRLIVAGGAIMALRGFIGAYGGPHSELLARLYPQGGQDGAFILYLAGMTVVFCGMGILIMRGSDS